MRVFRLQRGKYKVELSGKGASLSSNRWNSKGVEIIYCSESRALAMAEVAVNLNLAEIPGDFLMLEIEIPDDIAIEIIKKEKLPGKWNSFPHSPLTQKTGDQFIQRKKHCVLRVPSAVVPGDFNYLINSDHPDFQRIRIVSVEPFPFDDRLRI